MKKEAFNAIYIEKDIIKIIKLILIPLDAAILIFNFNQFEIKKLNFTVMKQIQAYLYFLQKKWVNIMYGSEN